MPRLLPQLRKALRSKRTDYDEVQVPLSKLHRKKRSSLWKPPLNDEERRNLFSLTGRTHSLLLGPIDYTAHDRHKSMPPSIIPPKTSTESNDDLDHPREMTWKDKEWWANPLRAVAFSESSMPYFAEVKRSENAFKSSKRSTAF